MIALNTSEAAALLLRAIISGGILGGAYDVIRFIRLLFTPDKKSRESRALRVLLFAVVLLTDLIFWIGVGLVSIALDYEYAGGVLRGLTYIGLALGFGIYYFTVGRLIFKLSRLTVKGIRIAATWAIGVVYLPISFIFKGIISLYHLTIGKIIGRIIYRITVARKARKNMPEGESPLMLETADTGGEEDFVYVEGKVGYRRSGRINFGAYSRGDR